MTAPTRGLANLPGVTGDPGVLSGPVTPQGALGGMGIADEGWDVRGSRYLGGMQGEASAGQVST